MKQIVPIVIHDERECIVVDGKKFCEEESLTKRDLGSAIIVAFLIVGWGVWVGLSVMEERWVSLAVSLIPLLAFFAWCFL